MKLFWSVFLGLAMVVSANAQAHQSELTTGRQNNYVPSASSIADPGSDKKIESAASIDIAARKMDPKVCESPIPPPDPSIPGNPRLDISCDSTCGPDRKSALPRILADLMNTESTNCFRQFFIDHAKTGKIDEMHGRTPEQIVDDLTERSLRADLTVYHHLLGLGRACAKESTNGTLISVKDTCYDKELSEDRLKASLLAHEFSHNIGYTHGCTGSDQNTNVGTEDTVPYLVNKAVEKC